MKDYLYKKHTEIIKLMLKLLDMIFSKFFLYIILFFVFYLKLKVE